MVAEKKLRISELYHETDLEDYKTEFKSRLLEGDDKKGGRLEYGWLKAITAFANSGGGKIYVGVNDGDRTVEGLDPKEIDATSLMVQKQVKARITPEPLIEFRPIALPEPQKGRYLLLLCVQPSYSLPVQLHIKGMNSIFVRHFGSSTEATSEEIRALVLNSNYYPFDELPTQIPFKEEDFRKLYAYYERENEGERLTRKELTSMRFLTENGKLTQGALLFKDDYDGELTRIECTAYPGTDKGSDVFTKTLTLKGNLLDEFVAAKEFIENVSTFGYRKTPTGSEPYVAYPPIAVKEALANAIGHRNYYLRGRQIEIDVFYDRLEVASPGSIPGERHLRKERDLAAIPPIRRNDVICAVLQRLHIADEKGTGFDKIIASYKDKGQCYAPYASSDERTFILVLPSLTSEGGLRSEQKEPPIKVGVPLGGKNDYRILSYCYNVPRHAKEIAALLEITPSTYFRKNVLDRLCQEGLLIKSEDGDGTHYYSNRRLVEAL